MKVTKHKVVWIRNEQPVHENFFSSKQKAMQYIGNFTHLKYGGEVEINMYCENCNKDLVIGDRYIKADEFQRYCSDCYEENTFLTYSIDGEFVGDENDTTEYDDSDREDQE